MIFEITAKGHKNITSKHKSTFEITTDQEITPSGDCIIGVGSNKTMNDFPKEFKDKIASSNTEVHVILDTENGHDEIIGYGHEKLSLTHPTDIVCRKSSYVCSRTLMIKSNKAAIDLDEKLIEDLANLKEMKVVIKLI
ncbi:MAG: DUF371 domain-containing protein [Methanobrevibacter sp.]|nr:DUF371 domain-containing protein [Methanobrevibacter sp.]